MLAYSKLEHDMHIGKLSEKLFVASATAHAVDISRYEAQYTACVHARGSTSVTGSGYVYHRQRISAALL